MVRTLRKVMVQCDVPLAARREWGRAPQVAAVVWDMVAVASEAKAGALAVALAKATGGGGRDSVAQLPPEAMTSA